LELPGHVDQAIGLVKQLPDLLRDILPASLRTLDSTQTPLRPHCVLPPHPIALAVEAANAVAASLVSLRHLASATLVHLPATKAAIASAALMHVLTAEVAMTFAALIQVLTVEAAKALVALIQVLSAGTSKTITTKAVAASLGNVRTGLAIAALGAHQAMTLHGCHSIASFAWASGLLGGLFAFLWLCGLTFVAVGRLGLGVRSGLGQFVPQGLDLVLQVANLLLERLLLCGGLWTAAGCIGAAALPALAKARLGQQHQPSGTHQGNHQFDSHKLFPFS
jgi:hypothetical protein